MTPAARLIRVQTYERTGHAGVTCRRCGVSRPTLRKWRRRYQEAGVAGLSDRSRRPRTSPGRRVLAPLEQLIIKLRKRRKLGIKRLRSWSIKFRPIRPRSPHLNGKVERVKRTAL